MHNANKIVSLLLKKYPRPKIALHFTNPLELLIATILSARCTDIKVNEVTKHIFKKYRKAGDYAHADPGVFEAEIKPTGFYKNKAKMVIQCCRMIADDFGGKVPDTMEALTLLPGVGRKTANVVLGTAFRKPAMAVDTHVLRVTNRLGLVHSEKPDHVEKELADQVPGEKLTSFNLALILHGRETCKAVKPLCPECILIKVCKWPDKTSA